MDNLEGVYQQWRRGHEDVAGLRKVFVVGCAKSGTTWVADLLNAHEEVVVQGEGCFTWRLVPILAQAFRAFNEHQKKMRPVTQLRDVDLLLVARTMIDSQLCRYVTEAGRDMSRIKVVGDKTPQHTVSIPLLHQLYPEAKFIHVMRDPRDAATSAWFHFGQSDRRPFEEYVHYYINQVWPLNVQSARQAGAALPGQYMEVRYEDLKMDGAAQVKGILGFIGVNASAEAVKACMEAASFARKSGGRQPGQKDPRSFYRSGTVGDWRNHIAVDLADRCCAAIAPLMQACGYDPLCGAAVA